MITVVAILALHVMAVDQDQLTPQQRAEIRALRRRRQELGWCQAAIAADIGVATQTVSMWELGYRWPSRHSLSAWRDALAAPELSIHTPLHSAAHAGSSA